MNRSLVLAALVAFATAAPAASALVGPVVDCRASVAVYASTASCHAVGVGGSAGADTCPDAMMCDAWWRIECGVAWPSEWERPGCVVLL